MINQIPISGLEVYAKMFTKLPKLPLNRIKEIRKDCYLNTTCLQISNLFANYDVPEDFILELYDKTSDNWSVEVWANISLYQSLSENFIRKFQDFVDWNYISSWQILSESFIQEFSHKISWYRVSYRQKLSKNFIVKFIHVLDLQLLLRSQYISEDVKTYIRMFI